MKIYEWTVTYDWMLPEIKPARHDELISWFELLLDSRIKTDKMKPQAPVVMPGLDKPKPKRAIVRCAPIEASIDWDAVAAFGLDEQTGLGFAPIVDDGRDAPELVTHPIRGRKVQMIVIDDVLDPEKVTLNKAVDAYVEWGKKKMAIRAECKFCHKTVGATVAGILLAHGSQPETKVARKNKVVRLDNLCKGSRMHVRDAVDEPVNDTRPCSLCGMPVVFAVGDLLPEDVVCPICLAPDNG